MVWKPHVTVAAVVEQDKRFLLVEEALEGLRVFNQPAGHLEENESLIDAIQREVLEETARVFQPDALVGIHLWRKDAGAPSFLRVCFTGRCLARDPSRELDRDIVGNHWLTRDELANRRGQLRSPLVLKCVDDYLAGERYPLSLLKTLFYLNTEADR